MNPIRRARPNARTLLLAALAVLASLLPLRTPAAYDVMLDVSGSMAGFARAPDWTGVLTTLDRGAEGKWVFGDSTRRLNGALTDAPLRDQTTGLGNALRTWLRARGASRTLVMLTDNVAAGQDGQPTDARREQSLFYRLLQEADGLAHIAVVPLRLPFRGRVYHPQDSRLKSTYDGPRALAVYVIAKDGYREAEVAGLRETLTGLAGGNWPYIRLRPFAQDGWDEAIRGSGLAPVADGASEAEILTSSNGVAIRGYPVGEPLDFTIQATVQPGPNFRLLRANLRTSLTFDDSDYMAAAKTERVEITPQRRDLNPGEPAQFQLSYKVRGYELDDLKFLTLLDLALKGSSWQRGEIRIFVQVARANVELGGDPAKNWNFDGPQARLASADAAVQSRIYRFGELLQGMIPERELDDQLVWASPVWVQVVYPLGPLVMAILGGLALLTLVLLLARQLAKGARYEVEDEAGNLTQVAPSFASTAKITSNDGATSLTIANFGLFHLHWAADRLLSSRIARASRAVARIEAGGDETAPVTRYRFVVNKVVQREETDEETRDATFL